MDNDTQPVVTAPVVTEPIIEQQTNGLPSANHAEDFSGFELNDDVKAKFKDGKLNGRFGNITEVLDKLKEAEDFKANTIRDQKTNEQQTTKQATIEQQAAETQKLQQDTVMEMLPEFLKNNMQLTPEMEAKATATGIDLRDLKLGALEVKEKTQVAHGIVGSSDEYANMMTWGGENMTDAQKRAFDVDVMNSDISEYAIKGLHADYKKAMANGGQVTRITGQHATSGLKPYATRQELFKDKAYIESSAGRRDTAAIKMYNDRKRITDNNVILGRQ